MTETNNNSDPPNNNVITKDHVIINEIERLVHETLIPSKLRRLYRLIFVMGDEYNTDNILKEIKNFIAVIEAFSDGLREYF